MRNAKMIALRADKQRLPTEILTSNVGRADARDAAHVWGGLKEGTARRTRLCTREIFSSGGCGYFMYPTVHYGFTEGLNPCGGVDASNSPPSVSVQTILGSHRNFVI